jgi:signal transduction histidine kinase/CheY-like chemotaxis protein
MPSERSQSLALARRLAGLLAIAGIYFAGAKLGLALATVTRSVTLVWPPSGLSLVILLLFGRRAVAGVFLGAFLTNALTGDTSLTAASFIAVGNALEAYLGSFLLERVGFDRSLERTRDVLALLGLAACLSTIVSATIGTASLVGGGAITIEESRFAWFVWWVGDLLSDLLIAPILLAWSTAPSSPWTRARVAEGVLSVAALVAVSVSPIGFLAPRAGSMLAQPYAVFPILIWAALRLGARGTTTLNFVVAGISIAATVAGRGPFVQGPLKDNLLLLAVFLAVTAATSLLLAAAVAERHNAENALREADRRKDDFIAMLGHELRNPLAPLLVSASLLKASGSEGTVRRVADVLERQTRHIARLVGDLLDVSRIRRGKVELRRERSDLGALVKRVVEDFVVPPESETISRTVAVPPEPVVCEVDETRIAQVLDNLLSNAVNFSSGDGSVRVALSVEGPWAEISVRDQGVGIPPELLPRLFQPFTRGDRSHGRAPGGLGLGLSVVKGLVELHGGTVTAASDGVGRGTEVTVRLPLAPSPHVVPPAPVTAVAAAPRARRVLIVEDNRDVADMLRELLETSGHAVAVEYAGDRALDAARHFRPEVVLCDLGLPVVDGFAVASRFRQEPELRDVRLVAVSGYGRDEDRARAADAGFDLHLTKPVSADDLERALA